MKNLLLNCALTNQKFLDKEDIIVIPVTRILNEPENLYLGTAFTSTFTTENPLGFDSLSTNKQYKNSLSVLKNYIKDITLIKNKTPIQVAQAMANNSIILHNMNRFTNSIHPWQEHELNFIFIKKSEFEKKQLEFSINANSIVEKCFPKPTQQSRIIKIDVNHLFSRIEQHAREHTAHIIIHFMRDFYVKNIYNQEKEGIIKMTLEQFNEFNHEFKNLIFTNSLHQSISNNIDRQSFKCVD